jgi:hypothetical protein
MMTMLGGDPNAKTEYLSNTKRSFVDHHALRPQREKRNANESTGFATPDAHVKMVTDLPKNVTSASVQAEQLLVLQESRARSTGGKKSRTASQVDCSIMGSVFKGVSTTASSLAKGRDEQCLSEHARRSTFKTDFEPARHPILHTQLPFVPPVYEHPGDNNVVTRKRISQNVVQRHHQVQSFLASTRPGKSFDGGVHL